MRYPTLIFFLLIFHLSCSKEPSRPPILKAEEYFDVSYGTDRLQKMDIYLPAQRSPQNTHLLIIIHGGVWSFGDKFDLNAYVDLAKTYLPGYAIANVNYRLITETGNKFPVQEDDINSAVQFLHQHIREYNLSGKFVVLGVSAGAHLGLLQAYKHTDVVHPSAVIDFYGPTDLVELYKSALNVFTRETLEFILQGTPVSKSNEYAASSPINYVSSGVCPTQIFHGGKDLVVEVKQSEELHHKLDSLHVEYEYIYYPDLGHGWSGENLKSSFANIKIFLETHVK